MAVYHAVCPPALPHRLFAARRRLRYRPVDEDHGRAEDAGRGHDRSRQPVRRGQVLQRGQGGGHPSGDRLRSVRFAAGAQDALGYATATTTWCCCARTRRATATSSSWSRPGYLEGFYYKPRIDMDLLARALQGADRHVGVPARAHPGDAALRQVRRRAAAGAHLRATFSGRTTSSSKCRTTTWSRTGGSRRS